MLLGAIIRTVRDTDHNTSIRKYKLQHCWAALLWTNTSSSSSSSFWFYWANTIYKSIFYTFHFSPSKQTNCRFFFCSNHCFSIIIIASSSQILQSWQTFLWFLVDCQPEPFCKHTDNKKPAVFRLHLIISKATLSSFQSLHDAIELIDRFQRNDR